MDDAFFEETVRLLLGCVIPAHDPPVNFLGRGQAPIDAFPAYYAYTLGPHLVFN